MRHALYRAANEVNKIIDSLESLAFVNENAEDRIETVTIGLKNVKYDIADALSAVG
jgi:hypothetical protein